MKPTQLPERKQESLEERLAWNKRAWCPPVPRKYYHALMSFLETLPAEEQLRIINSSQIPESPPTAAHAKADSNSLGDLLGDVTRDLSTLMRQELELAKAEAKQSATRAGKGGGMFAGGGYGDYCDRAADCRRASLPA